MGIVVASCLALTATAATVRVARALSHDAAGTAAKVPGTAAKVPGTAANVPGTAGAKSVPGGRESTTTAAPRR